jgi:hypothetical protein
MKRGLPLALILGAGLSIAFARPFYFGTWKITSAVVAPWADETARKPDTAEMRSLVGRTVTITATGIRGPRPVACAKARYGVKEYPADMLFQGAFDEMRRRNASVDPAKLAASVGFKGAQKWKTVETGCGNEIAYHFIDSDTAAFGLNDYVYTLKKQP